MLRKVLGVVFLFVVGGMVSANTFKADAKTTGQFKEYKDGKLTVTTKKKGEDAKDVTFKVAEDFKVNVIDGDNKKEATAKDAFKDLKAGTRVQVTADGDKISNIDVGAKKK